MKLFNFLPMILRAPEAEGGAGSVMFPDDKAPAADGAAAAAGGDDAAAKTEGDDAAAAEGAGDWKEYEPDPNKSDEENATAKAEHDAKKPADDPADVVPEDGKYTLAMPEGVELDSELADALMPEFKAAGLTGKQAQALVDKFIETQQARAGKSTEKWTETVQGWADTAKADKEIGGTRWDDTVKTAVGFMGEFTTEAAREYLNTTGAGNHPEMIRMARNAGKAIADLRTENASLKKQLSGEDNPAVGGAGGSGRPADTASLLFPTEGKKG